MTVRQSVWHSSFSYVNSNSATKSQEIVSTLFCDTHHLEQTTFGFTILTHGQLIAKPYVGLHVKVLFVQGTRATS